MKTKLTLSIDKDLVDFAHATARQDKRSISSMFADYLAVRRKQAAQPTFRASDMLGSLKGYQVDDSKAGIREAYAQKYLR